MSPDLPEFAYVTLNAGQANVRAYLGEEGAKITSGYGGWEVTARPRDVAMTTWQGRGPFEMDLPLLLDALATDGSVESDCRQIERAAVPKNAASTPPVVTVKGAVPRAGLRWVVESIDWGDALRSIWSGERVRQAVSLHLIEYQPPQLRAPRSKATPKNSKIVKAKKKTNTYKELAKVHLENVNRCAEIRKLNPQLLNKKGNPIRSPKTEIPLGTTVLVPKK